ncbi:MAG: rod shape-determining protein MreC [Synechococcales cyanobacterium RM1_1_8]|nr:rod shape-determining protein MreC [Synechococcales cyanobacterium RM1_1_8]
MLYHWWNQYWSKTVLVAVFLASAWFLRQTNGALLQELFYGVTQPLRLNATPPAAQLSDARTLELQERLLELQAENQQLRTTLGESAEAGAGAVPAPVIGRAANQWWQYVLIGRGAKDGIQVGSPVQAAGGVVGYIIQVTPNTSKVLLISDPRSSVGAMVTRTRTQGYVRGKATDELEMSFFEKDLAVTPGDVVVTSSSSTLFAPGLPIGVVQSVNQQASPVPTALVKLNAPIGKLEWMMVFPAKAVKIEGGLGEGDGAGSQADGLPNLIEPRS